MGKKGIMKLKLFLLVFFGLLGGIAIAQESEKEGREKSLETIVEGKEFRIESTWARAQGGTGVNAIAEAGLQQPGSSGNRFNLIGNFNYLEMKGDSVAAYLPYFGEQQFGNGHYSDQTAIEFEGIPRKLSIEKNEKKKRYDVSFEIDRDLETFQVNIQLYHNLKSQITVNSNQRFVIRYDGRVMELPVKKEGSSY